MPFKPEIFVSASEPVGRHTTVRNEVLQEQTGQELFEKQILKKEMEVDRAYLEESCKYHHKTGAEMEAPRKAKESSLKEHLTQGCGRRDGKKRGHSWGTPSRQLPRTESRGGGK